VKRKARKHVKCEIEFLPVGTGSKPGDAIVVRYGEPHAYELMIVDGGTLESGAALVSHVQSHFPGHRIAHVVLTHPDADHASGLRTVLEQLNVVNLWLHVPWLHAAAARPYFEHKGWTDAGLAAAIRKEYDIVSDICNTAAARGVQVFEPFAGGAIGPFVALSPHRAVYDLLLPQFDRTPAPDQAAIAAQGFWIQKQQPPSPLIALLERAVAKVQKWVPEAWDVERLRDGGVTSATNESSVVLYGAFEQGRVLLTGDAGVWALSLAAHHAEQSGLPLQQFDLVQVPHHGSRRNVGPTILNRLVGPIQPQRSGRRFHAFISAPQDDDTHPRKMVVNAFMRRGGRVIATQGLKKIYHGGFPRRPSYVDAQALDFASQVEEYE
jgi:beta-lactamase superfamily II metal-dependent hydrolase